MDAKAEKLALFRYGLIAPLVLETLPRGELTRRAEEIAARQYDIPDSQRISVSVDTLLEWALRYRNGGFDALAPKPRQDRGQSRAITPQLADLIERLKRENPHRTGTTLLRELALTSEQNEPGVSASTLYRFLKQRGLTERQLLAPRRAQEVRSPVQQSDLAGRHAVWSLRPTPGGGKMQVFLHAILDDASRLIPHAQFYPSQGLDACLDCLRQAIAARGVPVRLYIDNAKIYRSQQLARIAASLGILIVHTPPYQPEGRGKIERYFRTVRDQFLTNLDRKQSLSLEELNDRLLGLDRKRLSPLRAQRSGCHSAAALAARYRTGPSTPAGHRSPPPLLLSPQSPGAPRLHFSAAQPVLRSSAPSHRRNHRGAFRSSRRRRSGDPFPGKTARHGAPRRSRHQRRLASRETRRRRRTGTHRH